MTELKSISLSSISMIQNYRDIEPPSKRDPDIIELAASIKKDGVLQAILVRPDKKKTGHYQLVFGHRRYMAAELAELLEIPCTVKEVSDDDIIEVQVTENLQRKDVHPMDEAKAFQAYMTKKACDLKELSAKFAKSEKYIAQRIRLNNLIADVQKDFLKDKLTIAQAEVIGRVSDENQKILRSRSLNAWSNSYNNTPKQMLDFIESAFLHKLDKAPWKRDDATLVRKAGACSNCLKRTSCQAMLFADIAKDDRCTDGKCFNEKLTAHTVKKAIQVMTSNPEIVLIYEKYSSEKPAKEILEEAKKLSIPVKDSDAWSDSKYHHYTIQKKALYINGHRSGTVTSVYFKGAAGEKSTTPGTNSNASLLIGEINQRVKRSEELDYEKVMIGIRKGIKDLFPEEKALPNKYTEAMQGIVWFMLYDGASFHDEEVMIDLLIDADSHEEWDKKPGTMTAAMHNLTAVQKANILVCSFMHKYGLGSTAKPGKEAFMLRELATLLGVDIKALEEAQKGIADKRRTNADKRIAVLKAEQKKSLVKPAAKKAPAKKAAKALNGATEFVKARKANAKKAASK